MADEIELKTAPADFRFPTTNQTRHCFTRYVEFHRLWQQKVRRLISVKNSLSTIGHFARVNGLINGMNKGRVEHSLDLFNSM
ncbi:unnamed protein product [Cuscuta epithymum]|uniref:Uncharacterized protein n=1 Tax=Cuscuta epithymum TaxID=186058 RepID=A0AAV0D0A0_9ASTE|nr:unnamed protein product [Cuscuta epithymum]